MNEAALSIKYVISLGDHGRGRWKSRLGHGATLQNDNHVFLSTFFSGEFLKADHAFFNVLLTISFGHLIDLLILFKELFNFGSDCSGGQHIMSIEAELR